VCPTFLEQFPSAAVEARRVTTALGNTRILRQAGCSHLRIPRCSPRDGSTRNTITGGMRRQGLPVSAGDGWVSSGSNQFCRNANARSVCQPHSNSARTCSAVSAPPGRTRYQMTVGRQQGSARAVGFESALSGRLRHYATSRNVTGSRPDEANEFIQLSL
jgi:hypothetical protein